MHPQAEGFTRHRVWDFAATSAGQYPLMLHFPYFDLYRKQVVKQADLVLAMYLCGDAFTAEQKARNFEYYERLTRKPGPSRRRPLSRGPFSLQGASRHTGCPPTT